MELSDCQTGSRKSYSRDASIIDHDIEVWLMHEKMLLKKHNLRNIYLQPYYRDKVS